MTLYTLPFEPSTKPKQRKMLKMCVRRLRADPYVNQAYLDVIVALSEIHKELKNRKSTPAPPTAARATPALRAQIRAFAAQNPTMTQHDIGLHFGVQEGRVSESINGKRV